MIKVFRVYKYKGVSVYINGIGKSEKTGNRLIIWRNIRAEEGEPFSITSETEFEKEAKLIE